MLLWAECNTRIFANFVKTTCFRQGTKRPFPKTTVSTTLKNKEFLAREKSKEFQQKQRKGRTGWVPKIAHESSTPGQPTGRRPPLTERSPAKKIYVYVPFSQDHGKGGLSLRGVAVTTETPATAETAKTVKTVSWHCIL